MYEVTTQNQRVALVSTLAEAEAVVKMHKESTKDGKAKQPGGANSTAASRASYDIGTAKHPSGREL